MKKEIQRLPQRFTPTSAKSRLTEDDITNNNADEITGTLSTFHDIRISMLTVHQGYNSDGTGLPTFIVGAGEPGDLSVGTSYIDAMVEHRGSDHPNCTTGTSPSPSQTSIQMKFLQRR